MTSRSSNYANNKGRSFVQRNIRVEEMALLGLISWSLFVDAFRLVSICCFLLCSLSFNWYSFSSLIAILGMTMVVLLLYSHCFCAVSLYILDRNSYNKPAAKPEKFEDYNPFRRHKQVKDEDKIPSDVREKYSRSVLDLVLYDMEDCQALRNFEPVKNNTHCIFSKKSVLWGARDYDTELTLGENYGGIS